MPVDRYQQTPRLATKTPRKTLPNGEPARHPASNKTRNLLRGSTKQPPNTKNGAKSPKTQNRQTSEPPQKIHRTY